MAAWKIKEVCCNSLNELNIFIEEDLIKYQFKPSKKLEKNLVKTVVDGNSPLTYKNENYYLHFWKRRYNG